MLTPNFAPFPVLDTPRLILRQITLTDAPAVQRLRSDKEVMKYIHRPLTLTLEDAENWINTIEKAIVENSGINWGIYLRENLMEYVGTVGLWRIEKENYRAEIGYLLQSGLQRKGIMYEAVQQVIKYGFETLKLHSIEGRLDPENIASAALLKKAGFIQEGYFRENYCLGNKFTDTAVYSLITPERAGIKGEPAQY